MKIVGLMVCGGGEADRYLENTLRELKRLCDDAIIVMNGVDQKTRKMLSKGDFWLYEDNREWGTNQDRIKTDLLARVAKLNPDWILPLDADEVMPTVDRETLENLTKGSHACYFYFVNHWNEPGRYMKSLGFWNIRFFKYLPEAGMIYLKKPLHCGLAPPYFYHVGTYVPHIVRHYGLMDPKDRQRKIDRYNKYDPNAKYKDSSYYEALASDGTGSVYNEEEMIAKVVEEVNKMKQKKYE